MTVFERLTNYFTKNAGLNTVTGALIPLAVQQIAGSDPALAGTISTAMNLDVAGMMSGGGYGAAAAIAIVGLRTFLAFKRSGAQAQ